MRSLQNAEVFGDSGEGKIIMTCELSHMHLALRKSSQQRPRSNFIASTWGSRVPPLTGPEVPARQFRAAATDADAIERNHVLLGVSDVWQYIVKGGVIIGAVALDRYRLTGAART